MNRANDTKLAVAGPRLPRGGVLAWMMVSCMAISLWAPDAFALDKNELIRAVAEGKQEHELIPEIRDSDPMGLTPEDVEDLKRLGVTDAFIEYLERHEHLAPEQAGAKKDSGQPSSSERPSDEEAGKATEVQSPSGEHASKGQQAQPSGGGDPDEARTPKGQTTRVEESQPETEPEDDAGRPETRQTSTTVEESDLLAANAATREPVEEIEEVEEVEEKPPIPVRDPVVFRAPTANLLPAGVIFSQLGLDTGGGFSGSTRIGLGGVSEFGLDLSDQIRSRHAGEDESDFFVGFPLALFRLGVNEGRFWSWQPGMVLGYRKSFQIRRESRDLQVAELALVFTKSIADSVTLHGGAQVWDAEMRFIPQGETDETTWLFSGEKSFSDQIRGFGALELRPIDSARLMFELHWVPELTFGDTEEAHDAKLTPVFGWGVRNEFTHWLYVDAGVRLPDVGDANLINAEIFGQATFILRFLNDLLE